MSAHTAPIEHRVATSMGYPLSSRIETSNCACATPAHDATSVTAAIRRALQLTFRHPLQLGHAGEAVGLPGPLISTIPAWGFATRRAAVIPLNFDADRNVVYGLLISGVASGLARRWRETIEYHEHAHERIASTGAGAEWGNVIDPHLAVALAEVGDHERALGLALKSVERPRAEGLDLILTFSAVLRARALRVVGGQREQEALDSQIAEILALIEKWGMNGFLPLVLLERAGLARLRGDAAGMARDLTETRRLFAEMGITGWDDYARSIEA